MILRNCKLKWVRGEHGYKQGVKKNNYRHKDSDGFYNGYGGVYKNVNMELNIIGKDGTDKNITIDVRHYLLESIGRKIMNDSLYDKLSICLPDSIEIDDVAQKISAKSLSDIKEAYEKVK